MDGKPLGVCPYCGSSRLVPLVLVGGPMVTIDAKDDRCRCLDCGRNAVPIEFDGAPDVDSFFTGGPEHVGPGFRAIPLLPLQMSGLKSEPLVRSLAWESGPMATGPSAPIRQYLGMRGIANDAEMLLMDIDGLRMGRQETDALKMLLRRRPSAWLSMGMTSEQDLYDGFAMGAGMVIADTFSMSSFDLFEELYGLSDRCLPMVVYDGSVVWRRGGDRDLKRTVGRLRGIGYVEIVVFDVRALDAGIDLDLANAIASEGDIILGGGILTKDLPQMEGLGLEAAIVDPSFD